jgi:hypothetical protein
MTEPESTSAEPTSAEPTSADPTAADASAAAPSPEAPVSPEPPVEAAPVVEAAPAAWPAPPAAAPATWPAPADPAPAIAAPPVAAPVAVGPTTSSNAIIALILSIASWVVCPIAPAIVALVFASMAAKEIDAAGGRVEGRGLVTASRIVSWINIGFWAAVLLVGLFVLLIVLIAGGISNGRS